jgi:hypothetical protein
VVTRGYREFKRLSDALSEAAARASPPLPMPDFPSRSAQLERTTGVVTASYRRALTGPDRARQAITEQKELSAMGADERQRRLEAWLREALLRWRGALGSYAACPSRSTVSPPWPPPCRDAAGYRRRYPPPLLDFLDLSRLHNGGAAATSAPSARDELL